MTPINFQEKFWKFFAFYLNENEIIFIVPAPKIERK